MDAALVSKNIAPKEIAYSLYILALSGKEDLSTMNYYKSNLGLLAIDSRYLLACAYLLSGDAASYKGIQPKAFKDEYSGFQLDGSLFSYILDEGITLNSLIEVDPYYIQLPFMAHHLSEQM